MEEQIVQQKHPKHGSCCQHKFTQVYTCAPQRYNRHFAFSKHWLCYSWKSHQNTDPETLEKPMQNEKAHSKMQLLWFLKHYNLSTSILAGIASKLMLPPAVGTLLQHLILIHGLCSIYQGGPEIIWSSTQHSISFLVFYINISPMPYQEKGNLSTYQKAVDIIRSPSKTPVIQLPAKWTQFAAIISGKISHGLISTVPAECTCILRKDYIPNIKTPLWYQY